MPSLKTLTMSMSAAPVESVCAFPGNKTLVYAPVLDPDPSCVIITEALCHVARLLNVNVAL